MTEQDYIAELHRRFIVDVEAGTLTRRFNTTGGGKAGTLAQTLNKGYFKIQIFGKKQTVHRLIWLLFSGHWPKNYIDHINRIKTDNRISNLREVTHKQNSQNRLKSVNNTSGCIGVCWQKSRNVWHVKIGVQGKRIHIGRFQHLKDAIAARKDAEQKYFTHAPT